MFKRCASYLVLVVVLPILLVGCASNYPPTAIIGTWQTGVRDKKSTMTFWENGAWTYDNRDRNQTGTYKFVSDNQIEITVDRLEGENPIIYKRIVSFAHHDQMHLTDADTFMRKTWKRVEQQ